MSCGTVSNISIKGISCAVPDNIVKTEDYYDRFGPEVVDKFIKMTGVNSRYIASHKQCVSDLCYTAAKRLLSQLKWDPGSVDIIVFISSTPDYRLPPTACVLQYRLGLSRDCIAFDVNLGCSAYIYGIWLLSMILNNSGRSRALLLVGNQNNVYIDPNDRATAMLFGDAGSATAIEKQEGGTIRYSLRNDGAGFKHIIVPAGCARNRGCSEDAYLHDDGTIRSDYKYYLNGTEVFNFTITEVPEIISHLMGTFRISDDDVDMYVLHQANKFIIKRIASKLKLPMEKVPINIDKFGNTSGASIPLTLVDKVNEIDKDNIRLILCGFGVGLSWGAMYLCIDKSVCLPLIYSNDYFTGGGPGVIY